VAKNVIKNGEALVMTLDETMAKAAKNVLGGPLLSCSHEPLTGFFRDGHCNTCSDDFGVHTVCVVVSESFLSYSKALGNDLSTPVLAYNFPGLKDGDKWCLCAPRWKEAYEDGMAPAVFLEATHEATLEVVSLDILKQFAYQPA
jgi:uncharacterized protein